MQDKQLSTLAYATLFLLVPFLLGTAVDLYVPSLPTITHFFHTQASLVQLTISLYMLGYGVGQFFLGVLSDGLGRKKILLLGSVVFTVISLLAAHAVNVYWLIALRFLQGVGMAGMAVVCRAIAMDCYQDVELMKTYSIWTFGWAAGPIIGPFIGSYLQHLFNWQANFYYFGIYSFVVLLMVWWFVPETLQKRHSLHMGAMVKTIGGMLWHRTFVMLVLASGLVYSGLVIFNVIGPFLFQKTLHYGVLPYGRIALLLGTGCLAGSLLGRWLLQHYKPLKIVWACLWAGLLLSGVAIGLYHMVGVVGWAVIVPLWLVLLSIGAGLPTMAAMSLSFFQHAGGRANAVMGFLQALTIAVMTSIATGLRTTSQVPLFMAYLAVYFIVIVMYGYLRTKRGFTPK